MEINWNAILLIVLPLLLAGAGVGLGVWLFPKLAREKQGYPFEAELEAALLPIVFQGILSAYRTSERAMDDLAIRIRGADKKKLADTIYNLIPDVIVVQGRAVPVGIVKSLVTRDRFAELVQGVFDEFDEQYMAHSARWDRLFDEWRIYNTPQPFPKAFQEA